ncbi:MAG: hypothetical protein IKT50_04890 [Clostridia bacterium]|nr:hypothetical protein [Clostridia bacterium]
MYSGPLNKNVFRPDESHYRHAEEREAYLEKLRRDNLGVEIVPQRPEREEKKGQMDLSRLLDMISPEDSALIALIVFLLCDNTNNDVVLLGILLYVLLSK